MLNSLEEAAFRAARDSIARGRDAKGSQLHTAELYSIACKIAQACARPLAAEPQITLTVWKHGAAHVDGGRSTPLSFSSFVQLLHDRAQVLAPKGQGWVVEPVTNVDGRRTNASTVAMHALFLDCDGNGEPSILRHNLNALGYAYIVYESGGSTPEKPKWRVVLPLSEPFDVSSDEKRTLWKQFYNNARCVFGSLAHLSGLGFDATTETPCAPWFLTERRNPGDRPRQVWWTPGSTLDLTRFLVLTANLDEDPSEPAPVTFNKALIPTNLDEATYSAFIGELSAATSHIPSGRHDLYLCLPGVLLDRGIHPDTVLEIIRAVSSNYPRAHLHRDLHKDNIHNAKTTIAKWEGSGRITRIGTLQARWLNVAKVVDSFLPNESKVEPIPTAPTPTSTATSGQRDKHFERHPLSAQVGPIITAVRKGNNSQRKEVIDVLKRMQDGLTFTCADVDATLKLVFNTLGFRLEPSVSWSEVLDWAGPTLNGMGVAQSLEKMQILEAMFNLGRMGKARRNQNTDKKFNEEEAKTRRFLGEE